MKVLTNRTISAFIDKLSDKSLSLKEVLFRIESALQFIDWLSHTKQISENDVLRYKNELYKARKHFSRPKAPSISLPLRYVGFSLGLLSLLLIGVGIYLRFYKNGKTTFAYSSAPVQAGRIISFQGRLTDTLGNPISAPIDITYNFYTTSSGGSPITSSTRVCTASPDQDGIFNSLIGNDTGPSCNTELPSSIFTENPNVYLGVTIGSEPTEMSPRQQIANVGYAINSETLQGMPPGQNVSTIPFINQDGNMLIAAANPGLRSTYASSNFTISSAQATTIQSAGSGDITLSATEGGAIRFNTYDGSLAERVTIKNDGKVGIGTTAPRALFDVNGDATVSGSLIAGGQIKVGEFTSPPTNLGNGSLYYDSNTNKIFYWNGTAWIDFATSATQYWQRTLGSVAPVNITDDLNLGAVATGSALVHLPGTNNHDAWFNLGTGNVGIGNAAPGEKLDVTGNVQFSGALMPGGLAGSGGQYLTSSGAGTAPVWTSTVGASTVPFSGVTSGTNTSAAMVVGAGASLNYTSTGTINASSLEAKTWEAPGTIGSTTPNTAAFTTLTSSGNSTLGTGASSVNTIGSITTPGTLTLHGATTLDNTFTVSGSNLTSLGGDLTVTGTAWTATPTISGLITATSGLTANALLTVNSNATISGTLTVGNGTTNTIQAPYGPLNFAYKSGLDTWTNGLTLQDSTGNVGIGNTSPSEKLDVAGTASVSGVLTVGNGTTNTIQPAYGPLSLAYKSGLNSWTTGLTLQDTTGNVGIGTTNPSVTLQVVTPSVSSTREKLAKFSVNDASTDFFFIANQTSSDSQFLPAFAGIKNTDARQALSFEGYVASGNDTGTTPVVRFDALLSTSSTDPSNGTLSAIATRPLFEWANNGADKMIMLANGNVGIGNTSPNAKLDVTGTASISGVLAIGDGTTNTIESPYGPLNLAYKSGLDTWTTGLTVQDSTGNIGISNTAPTEKLDVTGNVRFSGALMPNNLPGSSGQFLISGGAGASPTWTSTVPATSIPFSGITSGTNTVAAMIVDTGASLTYSNSGTINASSLEAKTWEAPGTIGSTTPNTGAFSTLTSSGSTTVGTGASSANTMGAGASSTNAIGSGTTPGALTLHGATTLDNTFTVSGSNLTSLGGDLTVTGTAWTATPTISGLITATSGLTANGALTANNTFTLGDGGDTGSVNTSDWTINVTGDMTGIGAITANGLFTLANSATMSGTLTVGNGVTNTIQTPYGPLNLAYKSGLNAWTTGLTVQDSTGNIGISNTAPTEKLDVTGNVRFSGALMPNNLPGSSGQFLISGGAGASPTWTSTVPATSIPFSGITGATNTSAAMIVGTGASLTFSGSGTINASTLLSGTWAIPGTIGSSTPNTGAFTTLTSSGSTTVGTGASSANTMGAGASSTNAIGSGTTPGALTLHGATTLDNTFTVSGNNLTSLGGNLTVAGTTGGTFSGAGAGLTFSGTGTHAISNSSAGTALTIDAATTGKVQIGATSTGDVELAGGATTGCIVTNSTGDFTCTGTIAGAGITASSIPFSGITSATNTTAAMVVGAGASLNFTSTGTINASTLLSGTWAIPGTIGSTTANTGAFTTLTATPGSNATALTLTGTNVSSANLAYFNSKNTSGTIFNQAFGAATTLAGALTGHALDLSTNVTNAAQSVTGESITLPVTTAASTTTLKGLTLSSGALTNSAGTSTWTGLDINMPAITQSAGTLTSTGLKITGGTVTSGTSYALTTDVTAGNVGIGDTSPSKLFVVGNGDLFQVDSSGNIKGPTLALGTGTIARTDRLFDINTSTALTNGITYTGTIQRTLTGTLTGNIGDSYGLYNSLTISATDATFNHAANGVYDGMTLTDGNTIDTMRGVYSVVQNNSTTLAPDSPNNTASASSAIVGVALNNGAGSLITSQFGGSFSSYNTNTGDITTSRGVFGQTYNEDATGVIADGRGVNGAVFTQIDGASITNAYAVIGQTNEFSTQTTGGITTGYGGYFSSQDAATTYGLYASGLQNTTINDGVNNAFTNLYGINSDCQTSNATVTVTNCYGIKSNILETAGTITNGYAGYFNTSSALGSAYGVYANVTGASTTNYGIYSNVSGATTNYAGIFQGGNVGIGTVTPGALLDVSSAASSNPTFQLSDGDVAHGMTALLPTDALYRILDYSSTGGGVWIIGASDLGTVPGTTLQGAIGVADPTDTVPALLLNGSKANGTGYQAMGALETAFQVETGTVGSGTKLLTILGNGKVGIGTVAPTQKLSIQQDLTADMLGLYDGANNNDLLVEDAGVFTLKPTAFDNVQTCSGNANCVAADSTGTFTTNTTEAKNNAGTPFSLLAANAAGSTSLYLGLDHPFDTINVDIATANVGMTTMVVEYWNGSAWATVTPTDNTTRFTVDGTITFTAPSDWATKAVNSVTKYWIKVRNSVGTITTAPTANFITPTTNNRFYVYGQAGDTTTPALYVNDFGNVAIGTNAPNTATTPAVKLTINGDMIAGTYYDTTNVAYFMNPAGNSNLGGNITMQGTSPTISTQNGASYNTLILQGSADTTTPSVCIDEGASPGSCDGKLNAGTIDPPYTINGVKYATYLPSMTGIKEETTGKIQITDTDRNDAAKAYIKTIELANQPEGSDLWLFSKSTDIKNQIKDLTVLMSANTNAKTWYKVDLNNLLLTFYSSEPTELSYRLTAPRFDAVKWKNARNPNDFGRGFSLNDSGNIPNTSPPPTYTAPQLVTLNNTFSLIGTFVDQFVAANQALFANVTAGLVNTQKIVSPLAEIDNLTVHNKTQSPIVESDTITASTSIESPVVKTDEIQPSHNSVSINLGVQPGQLANLVIKGLNNVPVVQIDATGNATFSGNLAAQSLTTENASVSGTLVAGTIKSDNIDVIQSNVASLSSTLATNTSQTSNDINSIQQQLATLQSQPLANPSYYQNLDATYSGLLVTDAANIYKAHIADSLMVGTLLIEPTSITALSTDLRITALSTIRLFDNDAVVIAKNGDITTQGAISATSLAIKTTDGTTVASIDASGSAKFNEVIAKKFTLENIATQGAFIADSGVVDGDLHVPAIKTNTEVAGTGAVPQDTKEIIIYNDNVTDNSLIYLTPTADNIQGQLSVSKKVSCTPNATSCTPYFMVSANANIHSQLPFNWLIIN